MKAIKIDSRTQKVTEINLGEGIETICKELECDYFTCIDLPNGDALYIDDEGLLREEQIGAFMIVGCSQPLSGHGLIIGTDSETGNSTDCLSSLELIKKSVAFLPLQMLKAVPIETHFIALTEEELQEYWRTGRLPIGKVPPSPQ